MARCCDFRDRIPDYDCGFPQITTAAAGLAPLMVMADSCVMKHVFVATSNAGKIRDFRGAAAAYGLEIAAIANFSSLPAVVEDGKTFEANARKKAEFYSRYAAGEIVIADDSGLEVDALGGAPGVHSARYAADEPHAAEENTDDQANNDKLIREIRRVPIQKRSGRFICWIA